MRTAIDTNILSPVWSAQPTASTIVARLLKFHAEGGLVVCAPVFVELSAVPGLNSQLAEKALGEMSVAIDFGIAEDVWRLAASRFAAYANRRRRSRGGSPKRMLADFVIAAHAAIRADRLFTLAPSHYQQDFPELKLV
ncbi:MAG TPA: PIN domain-containing protein [Candidatus Sulfotelmatobacter sp.]|nr:PIN domain-containing protein [Candidatus Sulfotelmatobacter sp.]